MLDIYIYYNLLRLYLRIFACKLTLPRVQYEGNSDAHFLIILLQVPQPIFASFVRHLRERDEIIFDLQKLHDERGTFQTYKLTPTLCSDTLATPKRF